MPYAHGEREGHLNHADSCPPWPTKKERKTTEELETLEKVADGFFFIFVESHSRKKSLISNIRVRSVLYVFFTEFRLPRDFWTIGIYV